MRIRSNLTDETIYDTVRKRRGTSERTHPDPLGRSSGNVRSGGNQSSGHRSRSPGRRLMRLVILLVLVLILMREAANPDVYRNFFGALGAPLVAEPIPEEISQAELAELLASERAQPTATDESDKTGLPAKLDGVVSELGEPGRQRLTAWLAKMRRAGAEAEQGLVLPDPEILAMLASAAAGSGELEPSEIAETWRTPAEVDSIRGKRLRRSLQMALDKEYLSRVSDATIWNKSDADAFYRWLEIGSGKQLAEFGPPVFVGFVSLLDQPAVYRGGRVALRGTAVRAESIRAAANPFGIEAYWLIWVRPEDGSARPVMGYAANLPENLRGLTNSGVDADGPQVLLDGVFLRRHLYQSQKGSELAPVIVGRVRALEVERALPAGALGGDVGGEMGGGNPRRLSSEFTTLAAVAAVLGIGFTIFIARYTARTGRWRREVRQRGLASPVQFLSSVANVKAESDEQA